MKNCTSQLKFKVLALDGGGMRGLYTAAVLRTLANRFGNNKAIDVGKGFDLIVGTSTGGILAAGLASGKPLSDIISLYIKNGPKIFQSPIPKNIFKKAWWGFRHFLSAANSNLVLNESLQSIFGEETIGELYENRKIGLCLNSINSATHKPRVFKTAHNPLKNADDKRLIKDVCLASSAAPIIFPIANIPDPEIEGAISHFVDGGLWANNPILIALVEALEMSKSDQEIEILSIGTCPPPSGSALTLNEANRGIFNWNFGVKALELSMDAQASGNQFIANFLAEHFSKLGRKINIIRLEQSSPSIEHSKYLGLDDASEKSCSTLIQLGTADALEIYGKAINSPSKYNELISIFNSMPLFEQGTQE